MFDVEQLLKEGKTVSLMPEGYSMYPLFVPGRDSAIIAPYGGEILHRGDVILYRRDADATGGEGFRAGILVLHRICRVKSDGLYLAGDNQTEVEGPLRTEQVRGRLVGIVRNGKEFSVRRPLYLCYAHLWLFLRPVRHKIAVAIHAVKIRFGR